MSRIRSNRVCFTLNNYTEEDVEACCNIADGDNPMVQYFVVGQELGENGTPHLQGFINIRSAPKECGVKFWKEYFPFGKRCHFENARGTDEQNKEYCEKEGVYIATGSPGERDRFKAVYETAKLSIEDAVAMDFEFGIKHYAQLRAIHEAAKTQTIQFDAVLRPWQEKVIDMLKAQSDRQILFVVDEVGGAGKSLLTKWIMSNMDSWACNGKLVLILFL